MQFKFLREWVFTNYIHNLMKQQLFIIKGNWFMANSWMRILDTEYLRVFVMRLGLMQVYVIHTFVYKKYRIIQLW